MKRFALLLLAVAVIPLLATACTGQRGPSAEEGVLEGDKILDFKLKDLNGASVSFSRLSKGKVTVLDFSTTWCPPCRAIVPVLKDIYEAYRAKGLEVIAVYLGEPRSTVEEYATQHHIPYTVLLDTEGSVGSAYSVRGVPTIIIVGRDGVIKYRGHRVPTDMIKTMVEK